MKEKRLKISWVKNITLNIIFIIAIFSCKKNANIENKTNKDYSISTHELYREDFRNEKLTDSLKSLIHKGDTIAYEKLKEIYYLSGYEKEFFFYSYYMAKNFNYVEALGDCYSSLKYTQNDSSDIVLNKITEYFLLKAYEKKPKSFESSVEEIYPEKINIPKSDSIFSFN